MRSKSLQWTCQSSVCPESSPPVVVRALRSKNATSVQRHDQQAIARSHEREYGSAEKKKKKTKHSVWCTAQGWTSKCETGLGSLPEQQRRRFPKQTQHDPHSVQCLNWVLSKKQQQQLIIDGSTRETENKTKNGQCVKQERERERERTRSKLGKYRKLALVRKFLIKFSSLSAPTKTEELTAGSDEKTAQPRRKILGSIPGGAALCFFVWSGCQFFYLCRSWKRREFDGKICCAQWDDER